MVEAAFSVVRQPGPLHAFYERLRARRGSQIAVVASARKLACLFWCLLTREEQYAHQQPSLTAKKLGASSSPPARSATAAKPPGCGQPTRRCATPNASSPSRPRRPTCEWSQTGKQLRHEGGAGASVTPGRA
jgi:hypothetical protein